MRLPRFLRPALLLALALTASCTGWRIQPVAPAEYIRTERPDRVRITRTDQTTVEVFAPVLVGDSIRGLPSEKAIRPIMIPLEEATQVAIRKFSIGRTALLIVTVAAGLFVYDQLMALNDPSN